MARPTSWTPVREQELKPRAPRLPRGRPVGERARRWRQMLDEGLYPNMSELARAEGVSPAAVSKALLRLAGPLERNADLAGEVGDEAREVAKSVGR